MKHIFALSGDIFAFIIIRKSWPMMRLGQNKMTETESDFKTRRATGYGICALGIIAIICDHFIF